MSSIFADRSMPALGKSIVRVVMATAALLAIPLVAMQFTHEVAWTGADFAVAGALLTAAGLALVVTARTLRTRRRLVADAVIMLAFAYIWAELAVGIFTRLGS